MVGQGRADFILLLNGTIMSTQGMTWNGAQGFSVAPQNWNDLYVPYHEPVGKGSSAGAGIMGSWWEERGFTLSTVDLSGHMIPQYQPSVAYRQIEYLLGRIANLSVVSDFSVCSSSPHDPSVCVLTRGFIVGSDWQFRERANEHEQHEQHRASLQTAIVRSDVEDERVRWI